MSEKVGLQLLIWDKGEDFARLILAALKERFDVTLEPFEHGATNAHLKYKCGDKTDFCIRVEAGLDTLVYVRVFKTQASWGEFSQNIKLEETDVPKKVIELLESKAREHLEALEEFLRSE